MILLIILALIGIIINLFLVTNITSDGSRGPATTAVWGYGAIAMSTLGLMFTMFGMKNNMNELKQLTLKFSGELLMSSLPAFLMLTVLVSIMSLNGYFYARINKGEVTEDYHKYGTLATITISAQYFLLLYYIINETQTNGVKNYYSAVIAYFNYLFTLGNIIMIGILTIIVKYFTTDG